MVASRNITVAAGNELVTLTIIDYTKKNDIDIFMIGTKGISTVEEYFFGSVANAGIQHSHCPVFAIRNDVVNFVCKSIIRFF